MNGWIRTYRKLKEWQWYKKRDMVHLFIHLLLSANHKDGKWMDQEVKRGQLITGRKQLRKETGISEQSIRTLLNKLISTSEITIKSTNKYSIITICNYDSYQGNDFDDNQQNNQQPNQQLTNNQPTTNQQLTTNKNVKNNKNVIPTIEEVKLYCLERKNQVDPIKWFDFYTSKGWMIGKNKMKDWRAAVRTWEKSTPKYDKIPDGQTL
jgi:hypothetical protein